MNVNMSRRYLPNMYKNYYFSAYENKSKYIGSTVYLCFDKHYAVCPPYPNYCNDCERIIY